MPAPPLASLTVPDGFPMLRESYYRDRPPHRRRWRRFCETAVHQLQVTVLAAIPFTALYLVQDALWPRNPPPASMAAQAWGWGALLWTVSALPAFFELCGLYLWRPPVTPPDRLSKMVCWRVVSRGINVEALAETIASIRHEMRLTPLFLRWRIEVVMDSHEPVDPLAVLAEIQRHETEIAASERMIRAARWRVIRNVMMRRGVRQLRVLSSDARARLRGLPPEADDLVYIRVPKDYRTPGGTAAKARALHYALTHSDLSPQAWVVHMDEESHPTRSGVIGIAAAIDEEETYRPSWPRIGQGTITYHRKWETSPLFTLSDCIRTGSDLGRLYLSMNFGVPFFGLHGSFIVVRNDVEQSMGFDIGPVGSLTEDAWWGTMSLDRGIRYRWVEGYVEEQCTQKVSDFLKQRRRWFNGLGRTALKAPASLRWRVMIMVSLVAWASAPFAWAYTGLHLLDGGYVSPVIRALANFSLAVYIATTLVGLKVNMKEHGITSPVQQARWALTWLFCLTWFAFLESAAVAYATARPAREFHVVRK